MESTQENQEVEAVKEIEVLDTSKLILARPEGMEFKEYKRLLKLQTKLLRARLKRSLTPEEVKNYGGTNGEIKAAKKLHKTKI
jgi:hypothetical protein